MKRKLLGLFVMNILIVFACAQSGKPNVVIIYTYDLGYGDLSCYSSKVLQTPNIDALAKNSLLFTNARATSPTTIRHFQLTN